MTQIWLRGAYEKPGPSDGQRILVDRIWPRGVSKEALELDDWTRFDIGARYVTVMGDNPVTLRINLDNVTDEAYWASAFDSFRPDLQLGAPRTFKASATIDF